METRRMVTALLLGFAVFIAYNYIYNLLFPLPPQQPTTQPASAPTGVDKPVAAVPAAAPPQEAGVQTGTAPAATAPIFAIIEADQEFRTSLGGTDADKLSIELTSRGAAIETIRLTEKKGDTYVHRADDHKNKKIPNKPYALINPVRDPVGGRLYASFLTPKLVVDKREYAFDNVFWRQVEANGREVVYAADLRDGETDQLRIVKSFALEPGTARLTLRLRIENPTDRPLELQVQQNGPIGIPSEESQLEMRRLIRAYRGEKQVETNAYDRKTLSKDPRLGSSEEQLLWVALANKYFAVFTRPLPLTGMPAADFIQQASGGLLLPANTKPDPGDYLARWLTLPQRIEPAASIEYAFEIYAGTKNEDDLEAADPAYADRARLGYVAARDADQRCCCTFVWLTSAMTKLLEVIYAGVKNYGVAIMILVIIIRTLLHPLAVFQQKSMFRMQDAQARLKPRIDALREKYPNDKVKQNQEMMKIYSEEGVNPMASMVGMLPMLIQMPILIALWTALNTDVHLRHAAFDPWWITDLSAPDRLVIFSGDGLTIPILNLLPFIGSWFTNISSLNLLPILMGVSMWLQQKYMPKPGAGVKKAADSTPRKAPRSGMSPEDQARQQQIMMYMMSILFPLMFYYWPSGLNLYWMATNVFGIFESLRIRKQIEREKELGKLIADPAKPKRAGFIGKLFKRLAEQAEELQKKADALSQEEKKQRDKKEKDRQ